jgi:cytochrome c oxidase assembly protein subunit 15
VVIFQGVLGGLRVVLLKLDLAIVHACIAQAFFCLVMLVCVVTSKWWTMAGSQRDPDRAPGRSLVPLALIACVVVYLQLIVGATMRHYRAGLAIPDLPLSYGQVIPPMSDADLIAAQERLVHARPDELISVGQVWLAFGHRIGALLVSAIVIALAISVFRKHARSGLIAPAVMLLVLLATQVTLGVLTVLYKKPAVVASAHVAVGALVLMTTFVIAVRAMRLYRTADATVSRGFEVTNVASRAPQPARLNGAIG